MINRSSLIRTGSGKRVARSYIGTRLGSTPSSAVYKSPRETSQSPRRSLFCEVSRMSPSSLFRALPSDSGVHSYWPHCGIRCECGQITHSIGTQRTGGGARSFFPTELHSSTTSTLGPASTDPKGVTTLIQRLSREWSELPSRYVDTIWPIKPPMCPLKSPRLSHSSVPH